MGRQEFLPIPESGREFIKLSVRAATNPKVVSLSDAAFRLWVTGLLYCAEVGSGGRIPKVMLRTFILRNRNFNVAVSELLSETWPGRSPLWIDDGESIIVHDYIETFVGPKPKRPSRQMSQRLRFTIFERDNFTCRYCGQKAPDVRLEVDHVLPVACGGGNEPSNLVSACEDCNAGKSDKLILGVQPEKAQ